MALLVKRCGYARASRFDKAVDEAESRMMAVVDLLDLPGAVALGAPLAGLDLGSRTIAVSDKTWMIASPLALIERRKFTVDVETLFGLMETRHAAGLVIGLPVNMDGTEGARCQSVRAFARHLLMLRDIPIAFWDERLSSAAANRVLISEADSTRTRRAGAVDKMAAAWILQGALDRLDISRNDG
jgi:putative Holliday junction resolvase